jgi:hypothetical protein
MRSDSPWAETTDVAIPMTAASAIEERMLSFVDISRLL